jgi:hypothetical protein
MVGMGGVLICRACDPIIRERMAALRAEGKSVDVSRIARDLYREQFAGGDYLLREPPKDLMDAIKHRAVDESDNIRGIIIKALRAHVGA